MVPEEKKTAADVYVIPCESSEKLKKETSGKFDKETLRYKIIFFLHNGGLAAAFFYIAVLSKEQVGLSSSSLGAVLTVQMFLFIFTKPLIGYIADYLNSLKIIICILSLLNILCFFSLLAIPKIEREEMTNSSSIFKEMACNTMNMCGKCKDFLQFSQNSSNPTLTDSASLNLTDIELQRQSCMVCYLKIKNCLNTSETHFTLSNSEDTLSYLNNADNNAQNCVLFCKRNDSFGANFHSSQDIFNLNIKNFAELFCLRNLEPIETDQTLKGGSFVRCSQMSQNLQRTLFSLGAENFSENNKTDSKKNEINDFYTYQFWMFAILFSISNICENANFTLVDTACCESIEKSKGDFGKLRLWGNVGWGLFSPIGGLLNDYTGGFLASTVLMAVLLLSFLYNITQLDLAKPHYSKTIGRDVRTVFRSKEFLSFELINLMNGIGIGIIWYYLAWFLTNLGGSQLLCGLSVAVQSFGGVIPFMFFSGWIIRKVGHYEIISLTLMINGLRFLFYSQLYEPWWVLLIELSHGITYGLYYAVLATYGKLKAKPGTEATTQSILFTTHEGLGAAIGCGFAGIGFDYFGTHQTFFYLSAYFGCNLILSLLLYLLFVRKQRRLFTINPTP
ncbi:hypothetical protein AVEN_112495-1 [Araneus ventricosus]|uniref:Major facilitator superfamily associated domain-containing protein n=1 Tax=Araneus ventricosus TaxID=182803 RepID=A0A4Y2LUP6_ARAVE|nr:hypothetical protein AVEN_112495-1 [Araneus ventricosus]